MIVAITANRNLTDKDEETIFKKMLEVSEDESVDEVIFGGARGGDTAALVASVYHKDTRGDQLPKLTVIVPNKIENQPIGTRPATRCADEIFEMNMSITREDGWAAYQKRNEEMVNRAGKVIAFWNGDKPSGTWNTIEYAQNKDIPVEIVKIVGGDK